MQILINNTLVEWTSLWILDKVMESLRAYVDEHWAAGRSMGKVPLGLTE